MSGVEPNGVPQTRHLAVEWKRFQHALMRSRDPFHPFVWIYRLWVAAARDVCEIIGLRKFPWRPMVPVSGLMLILFVAASYFGKLRRDLVRLRWCVDMTDDVDHNAIEKNTIYVHDECLWLKAHDGIVLYLLVMILFHFLRTMFSSPGVSISEDQANAVELVHSPDHCCSFDVQAERKRTLLFCQASDANNHPNNDKTFHTDADPIFQGSFCQKCNAHRPPRSHHCSICQRCILQFDHHCIWLNNCIGYGNHRSFILTVSFVTIACWYGVCMLYKPFYEPLQAHLRQHGGNLWNYMQLYSSNDVLSEHADIDTLFDIPTLTEIWDMFFCDDTSMPTQAVVDVVFPLLLGVGAILAVFLGTHIRYITTAQTSLEHLMRLDNQLTSWWKMKRSKRASTSATTETAGNIMNPYDQGYYQNWIRVMGSNWLYLFLPIPMCPPPPYVPRLFKKKEQ